MSYLFTDSLLKFKYKPSKEIALEQKTDLNEKICDLLEEIWEENPKMNFGKLLIFILRQKKTQTSFYSMTNEEFYKLLKSVNKKGKGTETEGD